MQTKIIPLFISALPFGQLPILKLDNGLVLSQSPTIGRFLAKKFNLHGNDDFESAQIDEICDAIIDHELGKTRWETFIDISFLNFGRPF